MAMIPRPHLDATTIRIAEQVANAENRSLANSIARLVQEAWDARRAARTQSAEVAKLVALLTAAAVSAAP
jgi:hypothetical protein